MQSAPFNFRRIFLRLGRLTLGGIFIYAGYEIFRLRDSCPALQVRLATFVFSLQVDSYKVAAPPGRFSSLPHTLPFEMGIGAYVFDRLAASDLGDDCTLILVAGFFKRDACYAFGTGDQLWLLCQARAAHRG